MKRVHSKKIKETQNQNKSKDKKCMKNGPKIIK